ncbi:hypothetical protein M408DRAFT_198189 [Serendipita vermifera MAFF 305830]|uniref:Uncharacterized protein n=1 Tax=Serendipita vermifera MAFF 305830 TaxID=933852 RepID=A0A0C3B3A3_SERVB|nr:hypothetical protein M408DRAFT_198189 [Serendipita vermifera MAFF 305830]
MGCFCNEIIRGNLPSNAIGTFASPCPDCRGWQIVKDSTHKIKGNALATAYFGTCNNQPLSPSAANLPASRLDICVPPPSNWQRAGH